MRRWIFFMLFGSVLFACKQEIDLYEGESSIYFDDNYAGYYETDCVHQKRSRGRQILISRKWIFS